MSRTHTETGGGHKTFYQVRNGRLVHEVSEDTPNALPRVIEMGKRAGETIYELHEGGIIGTITGARFAVKDFGQKKSKEIQIDIDDDAQLQFNENMYLSALGEKLPLVDFSKEVNICLWKSKKGSAVLDIHQNGEKLPNYFTDWKAKEGGGWEPILKNGIPAVEKDELGDPDFRDRDKFLKITLMELFKTVEPASSLASDVQEAVAEKKEEGFKHTPPEDDDNIPF